MCLFVLGPNYTALLYNGSQILSCFTLDIKFVYKGMEKYRKIRLESENIGFGLKKERKVINEYILKDVFGQFFLFA